MKRLLPVLLTIALAVPVVYSQQGPGAFSTLRTTDTGANSVSAGCAVGSTTCTGGVNAGSAAFSKSVNGANVLLSLQNASTGNAAENTIQFGNNTASNGVFLTLYGGNHATLPNYFDINQRTSAPVRIRTANTVRWGWNAAGDATVGASDHLAMSVGTPTITSGFSGSPTIAGTDYAFKVVQSTATVSVGIVGFGHTWSTAPVCSVVTDSNQFVSINSISTSAISVATSGNVGTLYYVCLGY